MDRFSPFLLYVSKWKGIKRVEDKYKELGKNDYMPLTKVNTFFPPRDYGFFLMI